MKDTNIPERLRAIIEDFQLSEGREKVELLIEFSERMPALPERLQGQRALFEEVPECMTPVFIHAETSGTGMQFYFEVPPESPTVRGYAAILAEGLQNASPEQILAVPGNFYQEMGLHLVLSQQRLNGISAILAHIKRLAIQQVHS